MTTPQKDSEKFSVFSFTSIDKKKEDLDVLVTYTFVCGPYQFTPTLRIKNCLVSPKKWESSELDQYLFHIGLSEIPSYWKAFCSPTIEIHVGFLHETQMAFWQKLILHGMGEFFYVNNITPFSPKILCTQPENVRPQSPDEKTQTSGVLIPIGGGKDSIVTLKLFEHVGIDITTYSAHQGSSEHIVTTFSKTRPIVRDIEVVRTIDPTLIRLSSEGFLNGHTPFSSVVAFQSVCIAWLLDIPFVALSNERSANEATGSYAGMQVNHQYSKSYEFEKDFQEYAAHTFSQPPYYFSILRPLYELQIVKIFTSYPEYFSLFHSCNVGQKTNTWCGTCPKCTFVALMLSAFLPDKVVHEIFSTAILENVSLEKFILELLGKTAYKPFECVGTIEETWAALYLAITQRKNTTLPALLKLFESEVLTREHELSVLSERILHDFSEEHSIPEQFVPIVKNTVR